MSKHRSLERWIFEEAQHGWTESERKAEHAFTQRATIHFSKRCKADATLRPTEAVH